MAGAAWWALRAGAAVPAVVRAWSGLERGVFLGAAAALTAWAASRQVHLLGHRRWRRPVVVGVVAALVAVAAAGALVRDDVTTLCADRGGTLDAAALRCSVRALGPYLPGTRLIPAWDGELGLFEWLGLTTIAGLSALGLRDRREGTWRTSVGWEANAAAKPRPDPE